MLLLFATYTEDAAPNPGDISATSSFGTPGFSLVGLPSTLDAPGSLGDPFINAGVLIAPDTISATGTVQSANFEFVLGVYNITGTVYGVSPVAAATPSTISGSASLFAISEAIVYPPRPPSPIIRQEQLYQPQLTRWRSRYRGVRESYKINIEMDQIRYDVAKLYAAAGGNVNRFISFVSELYDGGILRDDYTWAETDTTSSSSPEGLFALSLRTQKALERLEMLENPDA